MQIALDLEEEQQEAMAPRIIPAEQPPLGSPAERQEPAFLQIPVPVVEEEVEAQELAAPVVLELMVLVQVVERGVQLVQAAEAQADQEETHRQTALLARLPAAQGEVEAQLVVQEPAEVEAAALIRISQLLNKPQMRFLLYS